MRRDKVYWFKPFKSFESFDVSFILPASAGGRNEMGDEINYGLSSTKTHET